MKLRKCARKSGNAEYEQWKSDTLKELEEAEKMPHMHPMLLRLRPKEIYEYVNKNDLGRVDRHNVDEISRKYEITKWIHYGGFVADLDYFEGFPIFDQNIDGRAHPDSDKALNPAHPAFTLSLPTVDGFRESDGECGVCLSTQNCPVMELPCGHRFHRRCIFRWFARNSTCPTCRKQYRDVFPANGGGGSSVEGMLPECPSTYDEMMEDLKGNDFFRVSTSSGQTFVTDGPGGVLEIAMEGGIGSTVHAYKLDANNPQILTDRIFCIMVLGPLIFKFNRKMTLRSCLINALTGEVSRSIWFHERYG